MRKTIKTFCFLLTFILVFSVLPESAFSALECSYWEDACQDYCICSGCSPSGYGNTCGDCCTDTFCSQLCGAECESNSDCPNYCVGYVRHYGRTCNAACTSCSCTSGSTTDCSTQCYDTCYARGCTPGGCSGQGESCGPYRCIGGTGCSTTCEKDCGASCESNNDCNYCSGDTRYYGYNCNSDCNCVGGSTQNCANLYDMRLCTTDKYWQTYASGDCATDGTCSSGTGNPTCHGDRQPGAWHNCDDDNQCYGSCPGCLYNEYVCSGLSCTDIRDEGPEGVCCATGTARGSGAASCTVGAQHDPDSTAGVCTGGACCTGCGQSWQIGGEASQGTDYCCGDDDAENAITETAGTDAPSGYGDGTTACCDVATDCVYTYGSYTDVCKASGQASDPAIPNKAYCNAGAWQGGDAGSTQCTAVAGANRWDLNGEAWSSPNDRCCGDDNSEFRVTEQGAGEAPADYRNGITTCCNPGTDCTHDDVCMATGDADGTAWCCSTAEETCSVNTWYGADDYSSACIDLVGSGRWDIGGDFSNCCGDDGTENMLTCQDGGAGACAESTDDLACCNNGNDCVYNNFCYNDQEVTPNGNWICDQGTWRALGITVNVIATPASVTTTWQNTDATANVECIPDSPVVNCDPTSYALYTSSTSIASCSTNYANYNLPDPQTISSHVWVCAAARDEFGTEGFSSPAEFLVDKIKPTASLSPLPAWTNQNSVTVGWSGSDSGGSGINQFELEYRITTIYGSVVQGWTAWTTSSSNPGSLPFSGMENNRTYQFRVRAIDNAGNIGDWSSTVGISVDLVAPTCQVGDLPMYTTSSSFIVSWSGSDGESGIQYYNVQVRVGESGTWGYLNDPDGYHTTETWDNVNGADGNTYFFRCNATDVAGNEGPWSPVVNTTVDATPPISSVDSLPPWLNLTSFTVSWNGSDGTSGIDCYDIQFDDGSGWGDWFTCTQMLSSIFGPDSPVNVTDNMTYSFRSRATDRAGNIENWPPQPDTYTTIDLTPPQYDLRAYDQGGIEISGYVQNVETVTIRSNATDSISGVQNNYVRYTLLNDAGETAGSQDCGSASPYGGVSECNVTVDFAGGITLEFWVEVIDRAGNRVISDVLYIGTHPLVNFREHNVYMSMGEIRTLGIQVRNMQNQADNVTITLSSNMPVAPYFVWVDDPDVEITGANNQTLIVRNLNPSATPPPFYVLVWSPDEVRDYQLTLDAYSALNITDSDDAIVQVGYPASFPGLNEWAIFVLIILSVLAYGWTEKK